MKTGHSFPRGKEDGKRLFCKADVLFPAAFFLLAVLCLSSAARYVFPFAGLLANALVLRVVFLVLRLSGVRFDRHEYITMGAVYALFCAWMIVYVWSRDFIYYWDYANYLVRQYTTEREFAQGVVAGAKHLLSTMASDYTSFICVFTEFPFCLTTRTGDAYVLCQLVNVFLPLLPLLGGMIQKIGEMLPVRKPRLFFSASLALMAFFPILRASASMGMPDWFGLVFALSIVLLAADYRFEAWEWPRLVLMFGLTAALVLTRRWYLYFIVAFYAVYALAVVSERIGQYRRTKDKKALLPLRNIGIFAGASLILAAALFWKMIRHILLYDYAARYASYNAGGMLVELFIQPYHITLFPLVLMLIGLIGGFRMGKRRLVICLFAMALLADAMFARVQNMGKQHILLLLPMYLPMIVMGVAVLLSGRRAWAGVGLCAVTAVFEVLVWFTPVMTIDAAALLVRDSSLSMSGCGATVGDMFDYSVSSNDRGNIGEIRALSEWIDTHCADGETAYLIPHGYLYNPDVLINVSAPDRPLADKLAFGFDVLGTHSFPTEFFDAKYVITSEPLDVFMAANPLSEKLNALFLSAPVQKHAAVRQFDMGDGFIMTAYERTAEIDDAEVRYYLDAFREEDEQFPDLFSEAVENWRQKRQEK